jgi:hypothetical protein
MTVLHPVRSLYLEANHRAIHDTGHTCDMPGCVACSACGLLLDEIDTMKRHEAAHPKEAKQYDCQCVLCNWNGKHA